MRPNDTQTGGASRDFPATTQGLLSGLADPGGESYREALRLLCARYWKPAYTYVRAAWAKNNEEAKDLTQAFFLRLLEADALQRFDPSRGSFRTYLKLMLRSFVGHQETALSRLKRGGEVRVLSLEGTPSLEDQVPDLRSGDPEALFEKVWVTELVAAALEKVRERYRSQGRLRAIEIYDAFEAVLPSARPSYRELGDRFGLTERQIKKQLFQVREDLRDELRRELAGQTAGEHGLSEEWNALLGS